MRVGLRAPNLPFLSPLSLSSRLGCKLSLSDPSPKDYPHLIKECDDFLPWLRRKTGLEISSVLSVGISSHGRSLFALKNIQSGECILKVPYHAQITSNKVHSEIKSLLADGVGNVSQLAIVLLAEIKLGEASEWAPYISSLPRADEMHNTIFWTEDELDMLQQSTVYQETLNLKAYIEKEFLALKPALCRFPKMFGNVVLEDFMHAYALVVSRAWGTSKGVSLIPFADFLNHDGASEAVLLSDDAKEVSEVIADRSYAAGEQILIRYGKFPNCTLLLDFGFSLPYNVHDQVQIWIDIRRNDPLYAKKVELLYKHCLPANKEAGILKISGSKFIIREVKSARGKGKGIPQALRAFARILSTSSHEELEELGNEAAENDGRLARRSLKDKDSEIQAHHILLSQFTHMIQGHDAAVKVLDAMNPLDISRQHALRRKMAKDLLIGELRVLRSACAWLTYYCATLSPWSERNELTTCPRTS